MRKEHLVIRPRMVNTPWNITYLGGDTQNRGASRLTQAGRDTHGRHLLGPPIPGLPIPPGAVPRNANRFDIELADIPLSSGSGGGIPRVRPTVALNEGHSQTIAHNLAVASSQARFETLVQVDEDVGWVDIDLGDTPTENRSVGHNPTNCATIIPNTQVRHTIPRRPVAYGQPSHMVNGNIQNRATITLNSEVDPKSMEPHLPSVPSAARANPRSTVRTGPAEKRRRNDRSLLPSQLAVRHGSPAITSQPATESEGGNANRDLSIQALETDPDHGLTAPSIPNRAGGSGTDRLPIEPLTVPLDHDKTATRMEQSLRPSSHDQNRQSQHLVARSKTVRSVQSFGDFIAQDRMIGGNGRDCLMQ